MVTSSINLAEKSASPEECLNVCCCEGGRAICSAVASGLATTGERTPVFNETIVFADGEEEMLVRVGPLVSISGSNG